MGEEKTRIAILGGGMGSLAAAWRLTDTQENRDKYCVTVYQKDWLLGGKCASTRDQGFGLRIEEHGIHLLIGFYTKALHLLRQVYDEARSVGGNNVPPFDDALLPWDTVWMAEQFPEGIWTEPWRINFPTNDRVPGENEDPLTPQQLVCKGIERLNELIDEIFGSLPGGSFFASLVSNWGDQLVDLLLNASVQTMQAVSGVVAVLLETLIGAIWAMANPFMMVPQVRRAWIGIYLLVTNLLGILREEVLTNGFDHLNNRDYREWLRQHQVFAVPPRLSWNSPPVAALYDLAFSHQTGLAAGVTLQAAMRMAFGYEGHFCYKMRGGMGEVVFSPFYIALLQRGVKFRFFHEVSEIVAGEDGGDPVVESIHFVRPLEAISYDNPLIEAVGDDEVPLDAWPSRRPDTIGDLVEDHVIERKTHFDIAILGISVGGLTDEMVHTLRGAVPAFARMIDTATHVGTQAAQLWFDATGAELGWPTPQHAMYISYERPFNSLVDMSHLIPRERWEGEGPSSVQYLCDELRTGEGTTPADVKDNAQAWLTAYAGGPWPAFSWDLLHDPEGRTGPERLWAQYYRANNVGSERYVTAGPGSIAYRMRAGESGFRNLALAGDWVRSDLSAGCLEGATLGGLDAGQAILDAIVAP